MNRSALFVTIVGIGALVLSFAVLRRAPRPVDVPAPAATERPAADTSAPATPAPTPAPAPDAAPRRAGKTPAKSAPATPAPAAAETAPATATLTISSDVPGAQVFLDRQFIGTTPAVIKDVAPGAHNLNVSANGFDPHVETIEVTPGARDITVRFREVRLAAAIDVVHKHRFGSCAGRLTADPQGLRYETAHKDDGFTLTLLELETFEVDYLNKNLRVQPRRGRRFDFTDAQGNADRLFVFHRDVERARDRLRKGDAPGTR